MADATWDVFDHITVVGLSLSTCFCTTIAKRPCRTYRVKDLDTLAYTDASAGFATWRNVWVGVFTLGLRAQHLVVMDRLHSRLVVEFPTGVLALLIIEADAVSLPADLRPGIAKFAKKADQHLIAGAQVFPGRRVMQLVLQSALKLTTQRKRPSKTFHDTFTASQWLVEQVGQHPSATKDFDANQLWEAIEQIERLQIASAK